MSCPHGNPIGGCDTCDEVDAAFEAGKRSALAEQPAQQEPVAWMASDTGSVASAHEKKMGYVLAGAFDIPLYTTPQPPAQPLTDDKYEAIVEDIADWNRYVEVDTAHQSLEKHVREVLTAHGITKGNT